MKKNIYILFIFLIPLTNIFSQKESASQSGIGVVYLIVPLSITATTGDLDFGEIILSSVASTETMLPSHGKLFVVSGHPNRDVTFTFISANMDNSAWVATTGGAVGNLMFVPDVELDSGTKVTNGDSHPLLLDNGIGKLDVWVGGSIDIAANQEHGDYTGLFTLSVTY